MLANDQMLLGCCDAVALATGASGTASLGSAPESEPVMVSIFPSSSPMMQIVHECGFFMLLALAQGLMEAGVRAPDR